MTADPMVRGAERSAPVYSGGTTARWPDRIFERVADTALAAMPVPLRMLDVGCGTGALLRELVVRVPYGESYVGVDPLPDAVSKARRMSDPRIAFVRAAAGALPFPAASFDLVVTTASLPHWSDPAAGVAELGRVLRANGRIVLVEVARTQRRIQTLVEAAGLRVERTETLHRSAFTVPLVRAFIASP
jgi:ubiquinone/menaquinone biosynthesis C-methylase UbiE